MAQPVGALAVVEACLPEGAVPYDLGEQVSAAYLSGLPGHQQRYRVRVPRRVLPRQCR